MAELSVSDRIGTMFDPLRNARGPSRDTGVADLPAFRTPEVAVARAELP